MMKHTRIIAGVLAATALTGACLTGCTKTDDEYFNRVSQYSFWDNTGAQSIPQYQYYHIMDEFLSGGTVQDGQIVDGEGKIRKVLFLGWDGVRADAMTNLFYDANNFDTNGYNYEAADYSGLHRMKESGGLYLAYAGGEKGSDSEQETSTHPGWTSELTGGWSTLHGVKTNSDVKNAAAETIMMKYAKLGVATGFAFDWGEIFDIAWEDEVGYILEHPELPITYRDIDRPHAASTEDMLKNEGKEKEEDLNAPLDYYNAVAMEDGTISEQHTYDIATRDYLLGRMDAGDTIVAGVFHRPDTNGHNTGFTNENPNYVNSVRNADLYLNDLLNAIEIREQQYNEKWLVIVAADHGGSETGHGLQILEHRTIWMACNIPVDKKYYGVNYDGFRENA